MPDSFILRAADRGHGRYVSTGPNASYIAGHPDAVLTRQSSFNFHEYQSGRPGFGSVRVFGDEVFSGAGCGYNMHPHHDFAICAFVLKGELTHINSIAPGGTRQGLMLRRSARWADCTAVLAPGSCRRNRPCRVPPVAKSW